MSYQIEFKISGIGGKIIYTNDLINISIPVEIANDYRNGFDVDIKSIKTGLPLDKHRKLINEIKRNLKEWAMENNQTFTW